MLKYGIYFLFFCALYLYFLISIPPFFHITCPPSMGDCSNVTTGGKPCIFHLQRPSRTWYQYKHWHRKTTLHPSIVVYYHLSYLCRVEGGWILGARQGTPWTSHLGTDNHLHSHSHNQGQFRVIYLPNLHAFGLWEEVGEPRGNPSRRPCSTRKDPDRGTEPRTLGHHQIDNLTIDQMI